MLPLQYPGVGTDPLTLDIQYKNAYVWQTYIETILFLVGG